MTQQTAVEWLVEQLPLSTTSNGEFIVMIPQSMYHTFVMKAKQMEDEQRLEAWNGGISSTEEGGKSYDQYYNETYCNKSDYHIEQHLEVISAKTEIENKLQEAAETNSEKHHYAFGQQSEFYQIGFIEGAIWYREQLKKK